MISQVRTIQVPTNSIISYLCIMGGLASLAVLLAFVCFLAWLCQIALASIRECSITFHSLDPVVQFLLVLFSVVIVAWLISSRLKGASNGRH